ncbi:MAG: DUF3795 domain-containing protein [Candidatus Cloacimonetes bacterium]|nr:DUF3795 domain-containing protein [Candidatus Cloacimonadota bacterium]
MNKEDIAYCGLNCELCKRKFANIRQKIKILEEALEKVNIKEITKAIPFMRFKYQGYKKMISFFSEECPGCRNNGGNPFCGIRKCAIKKDYFTCAECDNLCKKFKILFKIHIDKEIQTNINQIKENGIDSFVNKFFISKIK